jgi:dTDP-4-amino-4,6-dideoxygalactose transaminase
MRRNELADFLRKHGVGTMIHYPIPPHLQKAYKELNFKQGDFPIAEEIADTCLSLPMHPLLMKRDVSFICEKIRLFYA